MRLAGFACLALLLTASVGRAAPDRLVVLLQASNITDLQQSILTAGGAITHRLPLIDALGAELTPAQLDQVKQTTESLIRTIDDLAWQPEPEPPFDPGCPVGSHVELLWTGQEARWRLYNKSPHALGIDHVNLTWPDELGALVSASLDSMALSPRDGRALNPAVRHTVLGGFTLQPGAIEALRLTFARAPRDTAGLQRRMQITAQVNSGCETKLVPAYDEPAADSYFPGVSGAASLHRLGILGSGVTVAVLDSGLWEDPLALARTTAGTPRVLARYDAIQGQRVPAASDESGHGTHIASVIARSDATDRADPAQPSYRGIAPNANLVVVKAFRRDGKADLLDLLRGVQWIVDQRNLLGIRVLNLSFASRPRWPYWEDPLNQALMRAWEAGIFIVAAAGNEGPDPMTVGSPGNLPYLMTVGAITDSWTEADRGDDYIPDFSSRGPTPTGHLKPDLVAPGGHMTGITHPDSSLAKEFPEYFLATGEFVMTGSSQAAAVVSGLAALVLELQPDLTNDELKCIFVTSAEPAIDTDGRLSYHPFVQGSGVINARRALTLGDQVCEQQELDLAADLAGPEHFSGPAVFNNDAPPSLPGEEQLVAPQADREGPSPTRRWGAAEHLQRLDAPPENSPIDWMAILRTEQARIRELSETPR